MMFCCVGGWGMGASGELSTVRQPMKVPDEPGLSLNDGLGSVS